MLFRMFYLIIVRLVFSRSLTRTLRKPSIFHSLFVANAAYRTNEEQLQYVHNNLFPNASTAEIQAIGEFYPEDVTAGSPFDTGTANAGTPQYKRLAAFQGDYIFVAPRRLLLNKVSWKQDTFVFRELA